MLQHDYNGMALAMTLAELLFEVFLDLLSFEWFFNLLDQAIRLTKEMALLSFCNGKISVEPFNYGINVYARCDINPYGLNACSKLNVDCADFWACSNDAVIVICDWNYLKQKYLQGYNDLYYSALGITLAIADTVKDRKGILLTPKMNLQSYRNVYNKLKKACEALCNKYGMYCNVDIDKLAVAIAPTVNTIPMGQYSCRYQIFGIYQEALFPLLKIGEDSKLFIGVFVPYTDKDGTKLFVVFPMVNGPCLIGEPESQCSEDFDRFVPYVPASTIPSIGTVPVIEPYTAYNILINYLTDP